MIDRTPPLSPFASIQPRREASDPEPVRFFFFADAHAGFALLEKFVDTANRERPELLIDGGDIVEEGTQPEFDRAMAIRSKLNAPLHIVTGNHDVYRRGSFTQPPPNLPDFRSFDHRGIHFVLLDNQNETLSESQFQKLEADLKTNRGKTTLVIMHVPPFLSKPSLATKLAKVSPIKLASPVMTKPEQVERFTSLMSRYGVSAVLSGHTHAPDHAVRDGVQYVVAGSVGAKTPGPSIAHEFLDITVKGKDVQIKRVPLDEAPGDPFRYAYRTMKYVADMNRLNHDALGWDSYVPSNQVQLRAGSRTSETASGPSKALTASAVFEHTLDPRGKTSAFVEGTLAAGPQELSADLALGYKQRLLGDFNRGLYASGAATVNGGLSAGSPTAGVGARAAIGAERNQWTLELAHERATNRQATSLSLGYRF